MLFFFVSQIPDCTQRCDVTASLRLGFVEGDRASQDAVAGSRGTNGICFCRSCSTIVGEGRSSPFNVLEFRRRQTEIGRIYGKADTTASEADREELLKSYGLRAHKVGHRVLHS